jgi:hypothetical protein
MCAWYYMHGIVVYVRVWLQEITSRYVMVGQRWYDVRGISLTE